MRVIVFIPPRLRFPGRDHRILARGGRGVGRKYLLTKEIFKLPLNYSLNLIKYVISSVFYDYLTINSSIGPRKLMMLVLQCPPRPRTHYGKAKPKCKLNFKRQFNVRARCRTAAIIKNYLQFNTRQGRNASISDLRNLFIIFSLTFAPRFKWYSHFFY